MRTQSPRHNLSIQRMSIPSGHTGPQPKSRGAVRAMNKTELRFYNEVLCPAFAGGRLLLVLPQALVLDFGDGTSYRPDFMGIRPDGGVTVYEIKGGHVGKVAWSRHGIERFRRALDRWGKIMRFEMWVWKDGSWKQEI